MGNISSTKTIEITKHTEEREFSCLFKKKSNFDYLFKFNTQTNKMERIKLSKFAKVKKDVKIMDCGNGIYFMYEGTDNKGNVLNLCFLYNLLNKQMIELPPLPQAYYDSACAYFQNKIIVIGGLLKYDTSNKTIIRDCYLLDLKKRKWFLIADLPEKLLKMSCFIYNYSVHVIGIGEGQWRSYLIIYTYCEENNKWLKKGESFLNHFLRLHL